MSPPSSNMSSDEQRRVELRHKMLFPPPPEEKERKLISLKFNTTFGQETQISHWVLKRAGPPRDVIAHAMGFAKAMDSIQMSAHVKSAQHRRLLSGTAVTAFDKALAKYDNSLRPVDGNGQPDMAQDPDRTNFSLQDLLKSFIAQRTTNVARYNQLRGIQAYRKPRTKPKVDCHEWEDYFLLSVEAMDWLRGNDPVPTGDMLTRMYLDSYSHKWVSEYEKINGTNMAASSMDDITSFMHDRAVEADAANLRNQMKQGHGKKKTVTSPKKTSKASKYAKKPPSSNGASKKIQKDDPCPFPFHDHTWGECFNNINNPKAHEKRKERLGKKANSNGKSMNHAMQVDSESSDSEDGEHHAQSATGDNESSDNEPGFVDGSQSDETAREAWKFLNEKFPDITKVAWKSRKNF